MDGKYCCIANEERNYGAPQNEIDDGTCDGVNFNIHSRCCKDNQFKPCPDPNGCREGNFYMPDKADCISKIELLQGD